MTGVCCSRRRGSCRIGAGFLSHRSGTDTELIQRKALKNRELNETGPSKAAVILSIRQGGALGLTPAPDRPPAGPKADPDGGKGAG